MAREQEADEYRPVVGRSLECLVCNHTKFYRRSAQLNTSLATFFGFDWLNRSATCYVCERCRFIHWFMGD